MTMRYQQINDLAIALAQHGARRCERVAPAGSGSGIGAGIMRVHVRHATCIAVVMRAHVRLTELARECGPRRSIPDPPAPIEGSTSPVRGEGAASPHGIFSTVDVLCRCAGGWSMRNLDLFAVEEPEVIEPNGDDTQQKGRLAEFKLCVRLTEWGYRVTHADMDGFDVLVALDHGHVRIQVKSGGSLESGKLRWTAMHGNKSGRSGRYKQRGYTRADADIIACYTARFDKFIFLTVEDDRTHYSFPVRAVQECDERASFDAALAGLMKAS